jgi:hypothetical protein
MVDFKLNTAHPMVAYLEEESSPQNAPQVSLTKNSAATALLRESEFVVN